MFGNVENVFFGGREGGGGGGLREPDAGVGRN